MKKVFAIMFLGLLATACSKKEEDPNKESNIMLSEPKVEMVETKKEVVEAPKSEVKVSEDKEEAK